MAAAVLQYAGAALLTLFAFACWPPAALLVAGVFLLLIGLSLEGR